MAVTRAGSSSPSSKEGAYANPKGKVKKKAIAFKSKLGSGGTEIVKRKQPEDALDRTKQKAKRAKV